MDYLEFIARTTSHIPDKGQVTVRYFGLYANAHRFPHRLCRGGQNHQLPQADLRRGQATSAPARLSGASHGRRGRQRIFFMIPSLTGSGSPVDSRLFRRQEGLSDVTRTPKLSLTSLFVIIYASQRWLEAIREAKIRPQPADPKNQVLIFWHPRLRAG